MRLLAFIYTAVLATSALALAIVALVMPYGVRSGTGCRLYDALLVGVECHGFLGAGLVEFSLSFPLLVAQVSALATRSPWMLATAVLLWMPVAAVALDWLRRARTR